MTNYIKTPSGYARACWKCGGDGIYWLSVMTANGPQAKQDVCFPCNGSGLGKKIFASLEELEAADARNDKARARREAKVETEWEAKREEREAEFARREAQEEAARVAREAENARWSYLDGEIGDKVTVIGNIAVASTIETQFGTSRLIVIETADRQAVKLFTSAEWSWSVERDEAISVTGTIKGFGEYDGRPQTQLNRPKKAW